MTSTLIHPHSEQNNATGPIVAAFLHALSAMKSTKNSDKTEEVVYSYAAFEGMFDAVADEAITTDAHAALAIAVALWRIQDIIDRHRSDSHTLDVYDLVALDRVRLTLCKLWDVAKKPDELLPIATHFDLSMPHKRV